MDKLIEILTDIRGGIDYGTHKTLIDDGILDSFDIVTIIAEIGNVYDVRIPPEEIIPENFNSAESLNGLITRLAEETL